MTWYHTFGCALVAVSLLIYVLGIVLTGVYLHRERAKNRRLLGPREARVENAWPQGFPGVSLIKPLKGLEDELASNLRSFYQLEYPGRYEVVFSTMDAHDPALAVARRVAQAYPGVSTQFVLSDGYEATNPKVANLAGGLAAARFDLILQTDANTRVTPDYLKHVVSEMHLKGASLLSSIVVGEGERNAGAVLENLQLSAFIAPAACLVRMLTGLTCVIGKSMLFRRSEFEALGGLNRVQDYLAEDYWTGQLYVQAGRSVVLSVKPIHNVNTQSSLGAFLRRHARWAQMRAVISASSFVADLAYNPFGLASLLLLSSPWGAPSVRVSILGIFVGIAIIRVCGDALLTRWTRGRGVSWRALPWVWVKDLCLVGVWVFALVSRRIRWRGVELRLGPGSRLFPVHGHVPTLQTPTSSLVGGSKLPPVRS